MDLYLDDDQWQNLWPEMTCGYKFWVSIRTYSYYLPEIAIGGDRVQSSKDEWDRVMGVGNNTQEAMYDSNFR